MAEEIDDCGVCAILPTVTGTVRATQVGCPVHSEHPDARRLRTQAERDADGTTWRATIAPECSTSHPQLHADCDGCTCPCHQPAPPRRRWWHRYTRRNP